MNGVKKKTQHLYNNVIQYSDIGARRRRQFSHRAKKGLSKSPFIYI